MASSEEIEALVYRLVGDGTQYMQMMQQAAKSTEDAAKRVEDAGKKIEGVKGKLEGFAGKAQAVLAGIGLTIGLEQAFEKFENFERGVIKLNSILEVNGRNVGKTVKDYKDFATEMLNVNAVSLGTSFSLAKQAESFGLTGDAAKKSIKDALAFAAINDTDAQSMMRVTTAMAQGDIERAMMFSRMIPQLRGVRDETEFLARYQKLATAGLQVMGEEAKLASGKMKQLEAAFGKVTKEIGGMVSEAIEPLVKALGDAIAWFNSLDASTRKVLVTTLLLVAVIQPSIVAYGFIAGAIGKVITVALAGVTALRALAIGIVASGATAATLAAVAIVALTAAFAEFVWRITGAKKAVDDFNKSISESKALTDKLVDVHEKAFGKVLSQGEFLQGAEQVDYYKKALEDTEQSAGQLAARLTKLKEVVEEKKKGVTWVDSLTYRKTGSEAELEEAKANSEAIQKLYDQKKREAERLKGVLAPLQTQGNPLPNFAIGMLANKQVMDAIAQFVKVQTAADDLTQSLQEELATMGMGADEARIFKLQLMGATDEQLQLAKKTAMAKKEMEDWLKLEEKGKSIAEEMRTPQEKFNDRMKELDEVLKAGQISWEIYCRAVQKAEDDYASATAEANKFYDSVNKIDSAMSGSAEAQARVAAFRDLVTADVKSTAPGFQPLRNVPGGGGPVLAPVAVMAPANDPGQGKIIGFLARIADGIDVIKDKAAIEVEAI